MAWLCYGEIQILHETHAAQTRFCSPRRDSEASRATRCGAHYLRTRYLGEQVWHTDLPLSRRGQRVQQGRVNSPADAQVYENDRLSGFLFGVFHLTHLIALIEARLMPN